MVSVLLKDRNLLFVHIPKTGGGSISRVLRREPDAVVYAVENMVHAKTCVQQLEPRLPKKLSQYQTVAFVRNPWDWAVSGFLHVTQNQPAYQNPPTFKAFLIGDWRGADWSAYPEKFANPKAYVAYHTQITQWDHLCANSNRSKVKTVCKYERLQKDVRRHLNILSPLPKVNRSDRDHYSRYYDETLIQIVADRNSDLIDTYGYDFKREGDH
ncbi:MAG: sulfotransferase family 2 domain-containing protein [Pseudomonadota bacterium]